jgi:hypothetical protein
MATTVTAPAKSPGIFDTIENALIPAVTGVTQTSTQAQQVMTDVQAQATDVKNAAVGYGATTVVLQAIIAGAVVVCAYQLIKMNKRR